MQTDSMGFANALNDIETYLSAQESDRYASVLETSGLAKNKIYQAGWNSFRHKIPMWVFLISCIVMTWLAFRKNLSLIPLLGLMSCLYMMSELGLSNWIGFSIWLLVGLVIYFSFGYKHSRLAHPKLNHH